MTRDSVNFVCRASARSWKSSSSSPNVMERVLSSVSKCKAGPPNCGSNLCKMVAKYTTPSDDDLMLLIAIDTRGADVVTVSGRRKKVTRELEIVLYEPSMEKYKLWVWGGTNFWKKPGTSFICLMSGNKYDVPHPISTAWRIRA